MRSRGSKVAIQIDNNVRRFIDGDYRTLDRTSHLCATWLYTFR